MMKSAVVDFQCFYNDANEFIIKELAIVDTFDFRRQQWFFKQPHNLSLLSNQKRKLASWLTTSLHGMQWEDGEVEYAEVNRILERYTERFTLLFCKGLEKARYLCKVLKREVIDLERLGCPSLKELDDFDLPCLLPEHDDNCKNRCALKTASRLVHWCVRYRCKTDLTLEEARIPTFSAFPLPHIDKNALAAEGFYYSPNSECVRCVYCGMVIQNWDITEDILGDHRRRSGVCIHHSDACY